MRVVVITGASSGIGAEFARELDKFTWFDSFLLIARRRERMEELAKNLKHGCCFLDMDLTDEDARLRLRAFLSEGNKEIRMLVNCAGYGILGNFSESISDEQLGMIDLNCKALTMVTRECLPFMKENARMIQAASSAAFLPQPNFAVYAATKSYVLSFSRALSHELADKKIYVTAFCPGPIETEFFDIAERHGKNMSLKAKFMLRPEEIVPQILRASARKQSVITPGIWMKLFRAAVKEIPQEWILKGMRYL